MGRFDDGAAHHDQDTATGGPCRPVEYSNQLLTRARAYECLFGHWHYPAAGVGGGAGRDPAAVPQAVIRGLARAQAALEALPGESVDYRHLVTNETALWMALTRLYPDRRIANFSYIDAAFAKQREAIAERRRSASFQRIEAMVRDLQDD